MEFKTKNAIPGMELLDKVILDASVDYEIEAHHILTQRDIVRMQERGIDTINVKISDEYDTFNDIFDTLVEDTIKSINIDSFIETASLYEDIVKKSKSLKYDASKYLDKNRYKHLVNTVNISVILAYNFNILSDKNSFINIKDMALTAMLVDLGRTCIDPYILKRTKNKYSEEIKKILNTYTSVPKNIFEEYNPKYHPIYSYLLAKNYNLSEDILTAILYHHEKEFGENSLLGIELAKQDQSNVGIKMASIIKLADLYDAVIMKNVSENPKKPFKDISKQIDKIVASGFVNAKLTNILKKVIPLYQVGQKVELSDGTLAVVNSNETLDYAKPIVTDFDGVYIDLDHEKIEIIKHHKKD